MTCCALSISFDPNPKLDSVAIVHQLALLCFNIIRASEELKRPQKVVLKVSEETKIVSTSSWSTLKSNALQKNEVQ